MKPSCIGRRYVVTLHKLLGEYFRRLQNSAALWRSPNPKSSVLESINNTYGQRIIGAHNRDIWFFFKRKKKQVRNIGRLNCDTLNLMAVKGGLARNAGISRRAPHMINFRRLAGLMHQSVFPASFADKKNCQFSGFQFCFLHSSSFGWFFPFQEYPIHFQKNSVQYGYGKNIGA